MAFKSSLSALARLSFATALVAVSGGLGCNNDPGSGTLTVNYQFGIGGSTCADEGVTQVRVTLGDETRTDACADNGEITLSGIDARNYSDFLVEGIDATGVTIRDNLDLPEDDEAVEVLGGASQTIDVTLTDTPASIEVTFVLLDGDGVPYVPSADIPIETFEVAAAAGSGAPLLLHVFEVEDLEAAKNIVPDPNRDLDGDAVDTVVVSYEAGSGDVQVDGDPDTMGVQAFTFTPPGDGRLVQIRVTCMGDVCNGELEGISAGSPTTGGDSATGGSGGADETGAG